MGLVKALAIIVSLVLIAAFFLPYRSLNEEGKTALELLRAPAAAHLPATIPPAVLSACPAKNA